MVRLGIQSPQAHKENNMAITTTKSITVQVPSGNVEPGKEWVDINTWTFATIEEKQALMPNAKTAARASAGRVIVNTYTLDDAGSADETLWTRTSEFKVAVLPSTKLVSISATLTEWAKVHMVLLGQPWASDVIASIDNKLDTD